MKFCLFQRLLKPEKSAESKFVLIDNIFFYMLRNLSTFLPPHTKLSAYQSNFSMCCFNFYPSRAHECLHISVREFSRIESTHMNCKATSTLKFFSIKFKLQKGEKKNADDLLDGDVARKKSFIIFHRIGMSKKAIKTLKQNFFLCSLAVDKCWYTQILPLLSFLYIISKTKVRESTSST